MDLDLLLAYLDCWIESFALWSGSLDKCGPGSEHARAVDALAAAIAATRGGTGTTAALVECLEACLRRAVPAPPHLIEQAAWLVGIRVATAPQDNFDVLYQRTLRTRIELLDSMLRHATERGGYPMVPPVAQDLRLAWSPNREAVLCQTLQYKNYALQMRRELGVYVELLARALGLERQPASIVELGMCNLWRLGEELAGRPLQIDEASVQRLRAAGLGQWWGLGEVEMRGHDTVADALLMVPPSPTTARRKMAAVTREVQLLDRDVVFCDALQALIAPSLTANELAVLKWFCASPVYCKHASVSEAAVHAMGLGAPNTTGMESAFTAGAAELNADFGHLDYVFGRLEMVDGDHGGGTRYGPHHFCISLDDLGPQVFISLHDQGKPFSKPELTVSSCGAAEVRRVYPLEAQSGGQPYLTIREEWECVYGRSDATRRKVSFLHEVFYGPRGIRMGLALHLICEFRRAKQSKLLVPPRSARACNDLVKDFFRPQIFVPCMLPLDRAVITAGGVARVAHVPALGPRAHALAAQPVEHLQRQRTLFAQLVRWMLQVVPADEQPALSRWLDEAGDHACAGQPFDGKMTNISALAARLAPRIPALPALAQAIAHRLEIIRRLKTTPEKVLWKALLPPDGGPF